MLLIEWPERGQGELPTPDIEITLSYAGEGRHGQLAACSTVGEAVLTALAMQNQP